MDHVEIIRISGDDAFDAVDAICPVHLYLRDGQMQPTLLLREDGRIFADLTVCRDDESFIFLSEGPSVTDLTAYIRKQTDSNLDYDVVNLREDSTLVGINGPYSWEVVATLVGPEVIGMPYLTYFRQHDQIYFRSGKTGEFGYDILVPKGEAADLVARLSQTSEPLSLTMIGLEALDAAAFENGFFCIRGKGLADISPIELQLQWRLSYQKQYPGSVALLDELRHEIVSRTTYLAASQPIAPGDLVFLEGTVIGKVLDTMQCIFRDQWIGLGLIETPYAHAGIHCFRAGEHEPCVDLKTVSPPLINNRSLYINPQKHTALERESYEFPKIAD